MKQWHAIKAEEVLKALGSGPEGLAADEVRRRSLEYGPNQLKEVRRRTALMMFISQFSDFMILVLIAAALVSGVVGDPTDAAAIVVIILLDAVLGFLQEHKAEKAMSALRKMSSPLAKVRRNNMLEVIDSASLVPGDILLLEAGNLIPADLRLINCSMLFVDEAALTGESAAIAKEAAELEEDLQLGDRKNMGYKGTMVVTGRGEGVVVGTGMDTELGRIAAMLQGQDEIKTPLQKRLAAFGGKLAVAIILICAAVFGAGLMRGEQLLVMLLTSISLAVAAIPEALPAVVTISLALGARKMAAKNALIRKLPAVETLGSVTFICSDKTGTLTANRMAVDETYIDGRIEMTGPADSGQPAAPEGSARRFFLLAAALCNDSGKDAAGKTSGDPTEAALYDFAAERGFERSQLEDLYPRVGELPFDSSRKAMTTFHRFGHEYISFTKGAPDLLLQKVDTVLHNGEYISLDPESLLKTVDQMAASGLRVLCLAMKQWKTLPEPLESGVAESGLTLLGFAGMMDPPREEAAAAVRTCREAGIQPVMITGDHPLTAAIIARRVGILGEGPGEIITGRELEDISGEELLGKVRDIKVYARVAPEQKLRIVSALQEKGECVAMTGDGVNDAPALKRADIGISMGITGTDVARESSSMILLDDNFATIVSAVREGRRIYRNILRFILYSMTANAGTLFCVSAAPFLGLPLPMLPIQILWMNLLCDSLPGLALSMEPGDRTAMKRPPVSPAEGIFAAGRGFYILRHGLIIGVSMLFFMKLAMLYNMHWQTMVFSALLLGRLGVALSVRSESEPVLKIGLFTNRYLTAAIILTFIFQMAIVYIPALNPVFKTVPLSPKELLLTLGVAALVFVLAEAEKCVPRRKLA